MHPGSSLKQAVLCALAFGAMAPSVGRSAVLTVNSIADTVPANDGKCTLREAITAANTDTGSGGMGGECAAGSGADSIVFSSDMTIVLSSTLPAVTSTDGLSIDGTGKSVTVSGNNAVRVLQVNPGAMLELSHLTVANGESANGAGIGNEGGTVSVTNSTFSGNNTSPDPSTFGGGIYNKVGGTLNVTNSTFFANSADSTGGGIANYGTAAVARSTFSNNSSGNGGGIQNSGTLTVTDSTFSSNSGSSGGGGIDNSGKLTVSNSTFSGNISGTSGGGLYSIGSSATVTNSTFSGNQSPVFTGSNIGQNGGTLTLRNTIVANGVGPGTSCFGTVGDGGGNLRWPAADSSCPGASGDPMLAALASNGGATQTMALLAGSAAIDTADPNTCADPNTVNNLDQRGIARPRDGDGDGMSTCDIGAFENDGFDTPTPTSTSTSTPTASSTATGTRTSTPTSTATASVTFTAMATPTSTPALTATDTATSTASVLLLALLVGSAALLRQRRSSSSVHPRAAPRR